ncbi:MAG: hypothetical protein Q9162_004509 [Coniocarpon cinnabarinum]
MLGRNSHGSRGSPTVNSPSLDGSAIAPSDDLVRNGEAWATTAANDPWDPAILTLDGGGIRGYSSLLMIRALMHEIAIWERRLQPGLTLPDEKDLLPCHYFDFMYGTSTGGLIATMLGRLRMSVPQCLEIYREVGQTLFGKQRSNIPFSTKYHDKPLKHAVRDIVKAHCKVHTSVGQCDGNDWHPWRDAVEDKDLASQFDTPGHICQSICLTAVHNSRIDEAHLLRTYDHRYVDIPNWITPYNEGADSLRIWQVTRATSAAPFYFDILEADLGDEKRAFKDGGIRENNPSGAAWCEFVSLYGEGKDPACLLSIGTGRPNESQDGFATTWPGPFGKVFMMRKAAEKFAVIKNLLVKYTDGEEKHQAMLRTARGEHTWYKRLNVSTGLEAMPLDEWRKGAWTDPSTGITSDMSGGETLSKMEDAVFGYLTREIDHKYDTYAPPKIMLTQVAEKLVRQRLARRSQVERGIGGEKTKQRWQCYSGALLDATVRNDVADTPILHPVKKASIASVTSKGAAVVG